MAKPDENRQLDEPPVASRAGAIKTYRDKRYTSRVLILPDGRSLPVAKGRVTAEEGDAIAQGYLGKHPDLELLAE